MNISYFCVFCIFIFIYIYIYIYIYIRTRVGVVVQSEETNTWHARHHTKSVEHQTTHKSTKKTLTTIMTNRRSKKPRAQDNRAVHMCSLIWSRCIMLHVFRAWYCYGFANSCKTSMRCSSVERLNRSHEHAFIPIALFRDCWV